MKVAIFGAGAIGGYLGAGFARAGIDVSLVARGAHLAAMQRRGLVVRSAGEERTTRVHATDDTRGLGVQDYVIIALKAHSIPGALDAILPLVGERTTVVTAANGLPYWFFDVPGVPYHGLALETVDPGGEQRRRLGWARAVGCVVFPATEIVEPGVIRHEHGGRFPIGEPDGRVSERIEALHELFVAAGFEAPIRDDIRDEIWLKLWGNLCFNPVAALTLATIDVVTTDPGTRAVLMAMMDEAAAIGAKLGLRLRVDASRRLAGAAALGPHRMSMLQDLLQHRPMEVEALVGVIGELGRATGVPTPIVDTVHALIRLRAKSA
ncbi:MAG: 2-dehydropantoate 2-reductase [Proteobacteria bacterium]|jgi:2-dehydropantoate 2-reductase|nr:2-dehydropantoate 2-reductase [Pseudomonadota bacterium]